MVFSQRDRLNTQIHKQANLLAATENKLDSAQDEVKAVKKRTLFDNHGLCKE